MNYQDELPCGGFQEQDKQIEHQLKIISLEQQSQENKKDQCSSIKCQNKKYSVQCCNQTNKNTHNVENHKVINVKVPICKKCSINKSVLLHKSQPICKNCLLKNIQYKTRLSLQNKIKIKKNDSALICFSGGLNSICLVNLISSLKKRYQKNPLFDKVACIHILQQSNIPPNYVKAFQENTGLQLHIVRIQQIFQEEQHLKNYKNVQQIFSMFKDSANTEDLLVIFRDRIIRQYAKNHNYNHIFKGNNTQNLAVEIFKDFAKGKGSNITDITLYDGSNFGYPLREHLQKQLQYYFYSLNLSCLSLKAEEDDLKNYVSAPIDNYLQGFIMKLQDMYSHTAPAIVRTGQKIQSNPLNQILCGWCQDKCVYSQNEITKELCLRCWRIRQSAKPNLNWDSLPKWMRIKQSKQ